MERVFTPLDCLLPAEFSSCSFISLKQGHLHVMRDRVTTNRMKTFRIMWKYIVVPLCKTTVTFCIEFNEKTMSGSHNTL